MKYDLIVFDLDGTLVDSFADIYFSVNEFLAMHRAPRIDAEVLRSFIGRGVRHLISESLSASGAAGIDIDTALREYALVYDAHCLDSSVLFDGVADMLPRFAPIPLAVLSNKPEEGCGRILRSFGIAGHFIRIAGGDSYPDMKPSPAPLRALAAEAGADPGRVLMVGDSVYDIESAHAAGCAACAVTWGFQSPEMLKALNPEYMVSAFKEIVGIAGMAPAADVS